MKVIMEKRPITEDGQIIRPYLDKGLMVFDDPMVGLMGEALIRGTDSVIMKLGGREFSKFSVKFSIGPFPGADVILLWESGDVYNRKGDGNYYNAHRISGIKEVGLINQPSPIYSEELPMTMVSHEEDSLGEMWLCANLSKYFQAGAPERIFVNVIGTH